MKLKLALLSAVAIAAFAQGPRHPLMGGPGMMGGPGGPVATPNVDAIKSYLNLTDSQVTSLEALRTQIHTSNQQTFSDLRAKEQAFQALLQSSNPDPAAVGKALLDLQAERATLRSSHTNLVSQAVALLTPDQAAKLKTLSDAQALVPQIHEAMMLNLLAPPANPPGFGMCPGMGMGPGMGLGPLGAGLGRGRMGRRF